MSKPKEFGKLVEDLTQEELLRECARCKMMLSIPMYGPESPAGKLLSKRLHAVERRLYLIGKEESTQ